MVKADMTRDYYGDLEIQPTADLTEIKKQFKKLALTYHPDRNPGRESEVTAKFQKIQSANEVLSDPTERAKYDAGRIRSNGYRTGYQGASGVRGNPWSNPAPQWAPPPKPPGSRSNRPPHPPPPSAGAARYGKFSTPKTSANAAEEGAEARKKTYEAWESMRTKRDDPPPQHANAGRSSWKPPPPARDYTTPSAREESNSYKHSAPPNTKPGFEEYRANYSPNVSPQRRAQSTGAANRRFTPATPYGDEPAAPKGAYFTNHKPQEPPVPPPRQPPSPSMNTVQQDSQRQNVRPDPLREFRERNDPYEARISTPYATHGGEKLDPFDNIALGRSKSTRERADQPPGGQVPRTGSDPNLAQPHRSRSFVDRTSKKTRASFTEEAPTSSSSEDGPGISQTPKSGRRFAQPRRAPTGDRTPIPEVMTKSDHTRKPNLSEFQKWYRDNPGQEPPLNGVPSYGHATSSGQTNPQPTDEPNMYDAPQSPIQHPRSPQNEHDRNFYNQPRIVPVKFAHLHEPTPKLFSENSFGQTPPFFQNFHEDIRAPRLSIMRRAATQETVSHVQAGHGEDARLHSLDMHNYPNLFPRIDVDTFVSPDRVAANSLNSFEADQRRLVDQLISKRRASATCANLTRNVDEKPNDDIRNQSNQARPKSYDVLKKLQCGGSSLTEEPAMTGIPSLGHETLQSSAPPHSHAHSIPQYFYTTNANYNYYTPRFSFNIDDNIFASTDPQPNGIKSPSAENINTKFTPEEWEGKFEAGQGYFAPEQKAAGVPRGRAQSASRSRGRSPVKLRSVDPKVMQAHVEEQTPIESPGGTKFSTDEWDQTFKPQTFMPPPPAMPPRSRKGRQQSLRTTMGGNAAVLDDSENTSDEKPLFPGRKPPPIVTSPPSPDAMEVDTPPVDSTEPEPKTPGKSTETIGQTSPVKRAAAPSQSPTDSALKVEFDDLKLRDLISHVNMPAAPEPPTLPVSQTPEYTRPPMAAYEVYLHEFKAYMYDWDLFNTQYMMHMLSRKKENDTLGASRWESDEGLEAYRVGLKTDKMVLGHWSAAQEHHQAVMKDYAILKERMKDRAERERPRKKMY